MLSRVLFAGGSSNKRILSPYPVSGCSMETISIVIGLILLTYFDVRQSG